MHIHRSLLLIALLLSGVAPAVAQNVPAIQPAQTATAASPAVRASAGEIDFGLRLTGITGDPARYQRLRDLRSGPTLDRVKVVREHATWTVSANADHVGYRDQHYVASIERFGTVKAAFDWNQVPLFTSAGSRSPFREAAPGVFRLDDSLQLALQNGTGTLADYGRVVQSLDTRSRRDIATARVTYAATRNLDLSTVFTSTARTGTQPWGATFGQSNAVQVAAPMDHRTNDVRSAAEWSNTTGLLRLAYDGSWFNNHLESLVFDNPLRATDQISSSGSGPSQGRMALSPDSSAHTVSATASVALPARSRAVAYVSVGSWLQDAQLLPFTINTAITPLPLARSSAEGDARITAMTYRFTSRPTNALWLSGQYRLYDFNNRTPPFAESSYVGVDGAVAASATGGSEPFGYTRHFVDLDASFTPFRLVAFRAGYGQEKDNRTFRLFETTTDHVARASIDSTGLTWGSVRLQYDHAVRTGSGLDEEVLSDIGEQVSLRQFDISDRTRDRLTALLQVVPIDSLGVNASASVGQDHRPNVAFGLQNNDLLALTAGVDYTPSERVSAGVSYGFENYGTLQQSRQANPGVQFNDPTRDWWTDMDEKVHTLSVNLEVPKVTSRMAATAGYDYVGSRARYLYRLRDNTTLVAPQKLPPVRNLTHTANVDVRETLTPQLSLGVGYRFDHYTVDDFALSPATLNSPLIPTFVNLMNPWRPYDAHTGFVRLMYRW